MTLELFFYLLKCVGLLTLYFIFTDWSINNNTWLYKCGKGEQLRESGGIKDERYVTINLGWRNSKIFR